MKKFFSLLAIGATMIGSASGEGYKLSKTVTTTANGERAVLRLHLNDPDNEQVFYLGSGAAVGVPLAASGYGTTYPTNRASDFSTQALVNDIVFPWATSGLQLFSNAAPQQADVPIGTYIGIIATANDLYAQRGCSLQQAPSAQAWPSALVDYGTSNDDEALWGFSANSCPDQGRDDGSGVVIAVFESSTELESFSITAKVKDRSGTNPDRNIVINSAFSGGDEEQCLEFVYEGDTFNAQSQPLSEDDSGFTACSAALSGGGGGGGPPGGGGGGSSGSMCDDVTPGPSGLDGQCENDNGAGYTFDTSATYTGTAYQEAPDGCCVAPSSGGSSCPALACQADFFDAGQSCQAGQTDNTAACFNPNAPTGNDPFTECCSGSGSGGSSCPVYTCQTDFFDAGQSCQAGQTDNAAACFDPNAPTGNDPFTECCSGGGGSSGNPFCDSYSCGSGTTKSGASSIECTSGTCDDATCCDAAASPSPGPSATCDSHACPYGYTLKENPDQISGSDDATCCDAVSSSSGGGGGASCPSGEKSICIPEASCRLDPSGDGLIRAADISTVAGQNGKSCADLS